LPATSTPNIIVSSRSPILILIAVLSHPDCRAIPHSIPFLFPVNETFDVGLDTRSSVIGKDNLMPFRNIGNIDKLTVKLGPVRMADAERKQMQLALANAKD
jgi:hypothetical protein